jgi:hypothetical protein
MEVVEHHEDVEHDHQEEAYNRHDYQPNVDHLSFCVGVEMKLLG